MILNVKSNAAIKRIILLASCSRKWLLTIRPVGRWSHGEVWIFGFIPIKTLCFPLVFVWKHSINLFTGNGSNGISCCESSYSGPLPSSEINPSCIAIPLPKNDSFYADKGIFCQSYVRMQPTLKDNCKIKYEHVIYLAYSQLIVFEHASLPLVLTKYWRFWLLIGKSSVIVLGLEHHLFKLIRRAGEFARESWWII